MVKAWIVGADMGYGHARAALPLLSIAEGGAVINANNYEGIPPADKKTWDDLESFYYRVSQFKERGGSLLGRLVFAFYDRFQKINVILPGRSERHSIPQLQQLVRIIRGGWGKHLIDTLAKNPIPLVTTFFTVAHMAEVWGYPGPVYVIGTDSDLSRAWAPVDPARSTHRYFAPTSTSALHLELYGIPKDHVVTTGFPLPPELTQNARKNFENRLSRLAGLKGIPATLTFAVGGAGAQSRIGDELSMSITKLIHKNRLRLRLVAGANAEARDEFLAVVRAAHLEHFLGDRIEVLYSETKAEYFRMFERTLATTDILWTKPSELSFYAALGIPIIMSPPVGSQEDRNRAWVLGLEAGVDEGDPRRAKEWLPELLETGAFTAMAQNGYERMERMGAMNIIRYLGEHHRG